jgi:squalene-associated FAD-dependent desaturase
MSKRSHHIAVIGGGWAGCAAAVTLAKKGITVSLYEAARTPGGRARRISFTPADSLSPVLLDNGQHILLGAYTTTLSLLNTVGIDRKEALLSLPLQMWYPEQSSVNSQESGMQFETARLPAPWHLALGLFRAKGLLREDKLALMRFSSTARWMKWELYDDCSVEELLQRYDQTDRLIRLLWEPLCIAALNTPIARASAQLFLHVLRDSLGARRSASDMLIPRIDLTALFPEAAANYLQARGSMMHCGTAVGRITPIDDTQTRWQLFDKDDQQLCEADGIVIATSAEHAAQLLEPHTDTTALRAFEYEPITTCYLQYAPNIQLDRPFYALLANDAQAAWGQFVFDRGTIAGTTDTSQQGLLAVVISTSSQAIAQGHDTLAHDVALQLANVFKRPELATPRWCKVISDKRATFAATPSLARPTAATVFERVVLAGDYVESEYPATLETAMRNGKEAARQLMDVLV